jgi:hypothetical protein
MKECFIHCKKRLSIFPSQAPGGGGGCHGPNSPWPGIVKFSRPGRVWIRIRNPDPQLEKMLDPDPYPDPH